MRFIHTSDWHIGRLFQNQSLLDDQQYVLAQIKQHLLDQQADALVIAGDIFDRSVPPAEAVQVLDDFIAELDELDIVTIIISGNHDSAKRLRFGARQMQQSGLHIMADISKLCEPVVLEKADEKVVFYGLPYHDPSEVRLTFVDDPKAADIRSYDQAHTYCVEAMLSHKQCHHPDSAAVLLSHCFIDGASESDSERPLSLGGADRVSWQPLTAFDYVALGHLHGPQFKGAEHIRYSGSIMKYSFSEYKQRKVVNLVEITNNQLTQITPLALYPKRDVKVIEGTLHELLTQGRQYVEEHGQACEDYYLAKLTDTELMLDPMGQLRAVYPNVMQLERVNFAQGDSKLDIADQQNRKSESEVFADFYQQVMGQSLTDEQIEVINACIGEVKKAAEQQ
ncbi:exonuclease SbcCD subunit D [Thalassotalea maritima]|uniref:exonuclease SbcCD subunit D n=1 Tax=Thalassotalea maritima TaxID=3242416 RepID=UPI003528425B